MIRPGRRSRRRALLLAGARWIVCAGLLAACSGGGVGDGPVDDAADGETSRGTPAETSPDTPAANEPTLGQVPPLHPSVDGYPEATVELSRAGDVPLELPVKLADTPERRQHGLMEVTELPAGTGMLFVFDDDRTGGFWMKDTLVPLDIAFAGADGTIHTVLAMEPCEADPCPTYTPEAPYRTALEVPQGWFAGVGVAEGDTLTWEPDGRPDP